MYCPSSSGTADLDKEYSPSWNTKRFQNHPHPNEKVVQNFVQLLTNETAKVHKKYNVKENLQYGNKNNPNIDNNRLNIYYKTNETGSPIFVFLHGGYWQELDRWSSGAFVAPYVERGYRVLVVDYNQCPKVTLQQLTDEILEFFEWLSKYAKETDTPKIELCGHSAGAHLIALLFSERIGPTFFAAIPRITNVYLIGGVYDLRELWKLPSVNDKDILSLDYEKSKELSPLLWKMNGNALAYLRKWQMRVHLLVGEFESSTFINQSKAYAEKLKNNGLGEQVAFKLFENYDHFDIIEEVFCEKSAINKFLIENSM